MKSHILVLAVIAVALASSAQQAPDSKTVAITVNSTDPRVRQIGYELSREAKKVVERFKNVTGVIVDGKTAAAAETARRRGADFILSIEVAPRPTANLGGTTSPFPASDRAKVEGAIRVKYTVIRLDGSFEASDDWILREETYPIGSEWNWLRALSSRGVRRNEQTAIQEVILKPKGERKLPCTVPRPSWVAAFTSQAQLRTAAICESSSFIPLTCSLWKPLCRQDYRGELASEFLSSP